METSHVASHLEPHAVQAMAADASRFVSTLTRADADELRELVKTDKQRFADRLAELGVTKLGQRVAIEARLMDAETEGEELRVTGNGVAYPKSAFLGYYGEEDGNDRWKAAKVASKPSNDTQGLASTGPQPEALSPQELEALEEERKERHEAIRATLEEAQSARSMPERQLREAASEGDVNAVRKMLAAHASRLGPLLVGTTKGTGKLESISPLLVAAAKGHVEIVRMLLVAQADVNTVCSRTGSTALIGAAYWGSTEGVQALLLAGADRHCRAHHGKSAIELARGNAGSKDDPGDPAYPAICRLLKTAPWMPGEKARAEAEEEARVAALRRVDEHVQPPIESFVNCEVEPMPPAEAEWCEAALHELLAPERHKKAMRLLRWLFGLWAPLPSALETASYLQLQLGEPVVSRPADGGDRGGDAATAAASGREEATGGDGERASVTRGSATAPVFKVGARCWYEPAPEGG